MSFCHLHNHSYYSPLDGMSSPDEICRIAKEHGQPAISLTDHGSMSGIVRFQEAANKYDIKPIFGVEAYYNEQAFTARERKDNERFHLILLAENEVGLENLLIMQRLAWVDNFYNRPITSKDNLKKHFEGVAATSSCMGGIIAKRLKAGDESGAEEIVDDMLKTFERFYVELQPWNGIDLNKALIDIARAKNIPIIGTIDCHYPKHEHKGVEEVVLGVGMWSENKAAENHALAAGLAESKKTRDIVEKLNCLNPERRNPDGKVLTLQHHDHWIMSTEEVREHFEKEAGLEPSLVSEIMDNTVELAERCSASVKTGRNLLPVYNKKLDSNKYLRELAEIKMEEMGLTDQVYVDRLDEELTIIANKGFSNYFLVVWDLVNWIKNNNIYMGWGRGSAAGSLVSYVLGITKVDPIKYKLAFYRFISVDRADFPDIDIDVEDRRREDVKNYLKQRWGERNVAGISTYSQFGGKSLVKDIARIFGATNKEVNDVTQHFNSIDEYLSNKEIVKFREEWPFIGSVAKAMEGRLKTPGAHASGVVISNIPLDTFCPLETRQDPADKTKRIIVTGLDDDDCEKIGLIKFDILGLKNLSVIHDCVDKVKELTGVDVTSQMEALDREDIFERFTEGDTVGVFQCESTAYRNLLMEMHVDNFNDIVASNALVRPGAAASQKDSYIKRKLGQEETQYDHEIIKGITEETYGQWVYQEQIMEAAVYLAGMSWPEANILRKIIGKKQDESNFEKYRETFISGASEHISESKATKMWNDFVKFAGYGFNKSHAVAYSVLSYITMWLKYNYPKEYMWASLRNEGDKAAIATYLLESRKMGIDLIAPDINLSEENFSLEDNGIRFGLSNIANVGPAAVKEIISKRPFASYNEMIEKCRKSYLRANVIEPLIQVGALDSVGHVHNYESNQYYYKLLNYPIDLDYKTEFDDALSTCAYMSLHEKDRVWGVVKGIVKSTKRTPKYFRVEMEDLSGAVTAFASKEMEIKNGDFLMALIGDKGIHSYLNVYEIGENKDHPLLAYLKDSTFDSYQFLDEYDIGDLDRPKAIVRLMGKRVFVTKKGQYMAWYTVKTLNGSIQRLTIFPRTFEAVDRKVEVLRTYLIKPEWTKDMSLTISNNGIIDIEKFKEMKKIDA